MAVDLKLNSLVSRRSLIMLDDQLIALEHGQVRDRIRRYAFDRVESVLMWWRLPWGAMTTFMVIFGIPGLLLLLPDDFTARTIGVILLIITSLIQIWYLFRRRATIRITRAGRSVDFVGTSTPKRLNRFLDRLIDQIRQSQRESEQRGLARVSARGMDDIADAELAEP